MSDLRRGERNCNPGNIDFDPNVHWLGQLGLEEVPTGESYTARFVRFSDPVYGIRALAREIITYVDVRGCDTIRKIISRFAPPSDDNDTEAYIAAVASACGIGSDVPVTADTAFLCKIVPAIIHQENGEQPYDAALITRAVAMALGTLRPV